MANLLETENAYQNNDITRRDVIQNVLITPLRQTQERQEFFTRAGGVVQGTFGVVETGVGIVGGFFSSPTVIGAVGFGTLAANGADNAQAGFRTAFSGESQNTFLNEGLQAAGLSPGQAAIGEVVLSLGSAGGSLVAAGRTFSSRSVNALDASADINKLIQDGKLSSSAINVSESGATGLSPLKSAEVTDASKLSYDAEAVGVVVPNKALVSPAEVNWNTSRALGMEISDPREYEAGQQMFESLQQAGMSPDRALRMSRDMLESGVDLPSTVSLRQGDQLFKLVPTGSPPNGSTPYFVTGDVLERLPNNPQAIGEMLGLPQIPSSFELYSVTAKSNVDVFQSQIAKFSVNSGEHLRSGGEVQTLVTSRDLFTEAQPLNRYITGQ